ncbi:hypothetical protein [Thermomonospora umbrina]|uniref:hypothetical protein n=1 Tax=Thermomonospora umbrina TaxID=111806 RepID=UPI001477661F|nr:hypothetical protein [Thermomonospora umbrina]
MRLLECLELVRGDPRVEVVFTSADTSELSRGVPAFLEDVGARTVSWERAASTRYDLAVTAASSGPLHEIDAPLLSLPHGMGYNKVRQTTNDKRQTTNDKRQTTNDKRTYGLDADQLMHAGEVVPRVLILSHSEQRDRLADHCPQAVPRTLIAGDPAFDRLTASLPWRAAYRRALGVAPGQNLVVVTSTWGRGSLLDRRPALPAELLRGLPMDEYRVAAILHPNITAHHGEWNVRSWLADARAAGLVVIPRRSGWQAALTAADLVIGDHGSVTLYGACLGHPVLLAGFDDSAIVPGTAMADLGRMAHRLDPTRPLRPQLAEARAFGGLRSRAVENVGRCAAVLRAAMYDLMELPEPETPAFYGPADDPVPEPSPPLTAHFATTSVTGSTVRIERFPVTSDVEDPHFVIDDEERNPALRGLAETLIRRGDGLTADRSPGEVFAAYPGHRRVADVRPGTAVIWERDGSRRVITGSLDPALYPLVLHALPDPPPRVTIVVGERRDVLRVGQPSPRRS